MAVSNATQTPAPTAGAGNRSIRKLAHFNHGLSAAELINLAGPHDVLVSFHADTKAIASIVVPAVVPLLIAKAYPDTPLNKVILSQWVLRSWTAAILLCKPS